MARVGNIITYIGTIVAVILGVMQVANMTKRSRPILKYHVECADIHDDQTMFALESGKCSPRLDNIPENKKHVDSIREIKKLQFCEVIIKNTGNSDLHYDNLYPDAPLRICFKSYVPGHSFVYLDMSESEKYMGAFIKEVHDGCAYIEFNAWEPKSIVKAKFLTDTNVARIQVLARSKFFSKVEPSDSGTARIAGDWAKASELDPQMRFLDYLIYCAMFFCCLSLIVLCFEKKLKNLCKCYFRNTRKKKQKKETM